MFFKFGVRIEDKIIFIFFCKKFIIVVDDNVVLNVEGCLNEGDFIWFFVIRYLFEIKFVEVECLFY